VRHPIYAGYLVTQLAFVAAHPLAWNLTVLACADPALTVQALLEERVLRGDESYRAHGDRVAWHLVPGLF
jgi:protein-S-isoprenylcysteine O-methyltransferase Ste14